LIIPRICGGRNERKVEFMENRVVIAGTACIVNSKLSVKELEDFTHFHPEALILRNEAGEEVFSIGVIDGPGCLESDHAMYSSVESAQGKAVMTILLDPDEEDKLSLVMDTFGSALLRLEELENQLLGMKDTIEAEKKQIEEMIVQL